VAKTDLAIGPSRAALLPGLSTIVTLDGRPRSRDSWCFAERERYIDANSPALGRDRMWRLAPCYDLTFNRGPGGEHQMDVCGEGRNITREHMLQLAKQRGLRPRATAPAPDRFLEHTGLFRRLAADSRIRAATVQAIAAAIEANRDRLARRP
jgi:serine/threonine-protein kinase HipA